MELQRSMQDLPEGLRFIPERIRTFAVLSHCHMESSVSRIFLTIMSQYAFLSFTYNYDKHIALNHRARLFTTFVVIQL